MPKLTWMNKKPQRINHLAALFREYRVRTGISAAKVAEAVGCSEENARCQMNKRVEQWNIGKLFEYCNVLGIPHMDAFEAIEKSRLPAVETGKRQRKTVT